MSEIYKQETPPLPADGVCDLGAPGVDDCRGAMCPCCHLAQGTAGHPYAKEIADLLLRIQAHNFSLKSVDDGDFERQPVDNDAKKALDIILGVDDSHLYVTSPEKREHLMYLVLGNEPGVLVCDYSSHPELDRITEEHYEKWTEK